MCSKRRGGDDGLGQKRVRTQAQNHQSRVRDQERHGATICEVRRRVQGRRLVAGNRSVVFESNRRSDIPDRQSGFSITSIYRTVVASARQTDLGVRVCRLALYFFEDPQQDYMFFSCFQ